MSRPRVLIWQETYWVGGSDRFLVDLMEGLRPEMDLRLAGNPLPALDAWLSDHLAWALPRVTVPVANLVDSPLQRLKPRSAPQAPLLASEADGAPARPSVLAAGTLALRAAAAAQNAVRAERLLRAARPDALLLNNGGYPGGESCRVLAAVAGRLGVPRVVHVVHNMAYPRAWPAAFEARLDAAADRATSAWVTAAHRTGDALAEHRDIARDRIRTVHYGIPEPPAAPSSARIAALREALGFATERAFGFLCVAAFERRKGHQVLIDALAGVPGHVRIALVGRGPEEPAVRRAVAAAGLGDRVTLLGWRGDVDDLLHAADGLVLPSLGNECLPYAIMEAMAHGLPVVGTDVAGIPEEVDDGVTGLVVPPGDVAALRRALCRIGEEPAAAGRMGTAGRERFERMFARDRMVASMRELLAA